MFSNISKRASCFAFLLVVLMLAAGAAFAQEDKSARVGGPNPSVTGTATTDRIRIAAPSAVVQLRLEVYDDAGQKLLDTEQRGGNVLDWHLQGGTGERVADGAYLCVVTVKNLSGRLSQKLGLVTVSGGATKLRPAAIAELNPRQTQAVGPIEGEDEGLAVMSAADAQPVTVLANTGDEAQLARTRGSLTFRVGDFFSGTDKEQMRLTEDGDLGIGTANPKAKLDVAGTIRARGGFAFSDGSTLNVNDKGVLTRTSANGEVTPNAGTQNRIAKWTDNAGTLGDSLLSESGGGIEVRPAAAGGSGVNPIILNPNNVAGFAQFQFYPVAGPNANMSFTVVPRGTGTPNNKAQFSIFGTDLFADATNYEFASLRARGTDFVFGTGKSGTGQVRPLMLAAGFLSDNTTNNGQLFLDTNGRVGIGTTNPQRPFEIANGQLRLSSNLGDIEFTEVADLIAHATDANPVGTDPAFRVDTGTNLTQRFTVLNNGSVGIGTINPNKGILDVRSNGIGVYANGDFGAVVGESNAGNVMELITGSGRPLYLEITDSLSNRDFVDGVAHDSQGNFPQVFHITHGGTYVAGSDFAEALPARGGKVGYEPGDVLVVSANAPGKVEKSSHPYDARVAGVYSTRPGMLGAEKNGASRVDDDDVPVAIVGIVPTKVSAENGPLQVGDLLTTSRIPGYAMKASPILMRGVKVYRTGTILGKALEPLKNGKGVIKVLVTLR